jgi:hypothetical protein
MGAKRILRVLPQQYLFCLNIAGATNKSVKAAPEKD